MRSRDLWARCAVLAVALAGVACGGGDDAPALTVAQPAPIVITSTTAPADLRGSLSVSLSDGSAAAWRVEPSSVPAYLKLARSAGITGVDPIAYEVDVAEAPQGRLSTFDLTVLVDSPDVTPVQVPFSVDERLPRLGSAQPAVVDVGQRSFSLPLLVSGSFPEDVVANGKLEVFGATVFGASIEQPQLSARPPGSSRFATHLRVWLDRVTEGVPVTLRLDYGLLRTTITVPVVARAVPPSHFATLPFEVRRPPVYSADQQAYFYLSGGSVKRLALQGGAWVESSRALAEPLDLDLARRGASLVVLTREGMVELDAVTLTVRRPSLLGFSSRPLPSGLWNSWNKHLVVSITDRMWWLDVDVGCAASPRTADLSDPPLESASPLHITCNGTNSGFGLLASGDRNLIRFFKNDASANHQSWSTARDEVGTARHPVASARGLVTTTYVGGAVLTGAGGFFIGTPDFAEARTVEWAPAGRTVGAYGMAPSDDYALSYAYQLTAGAQGAAATAPTLYLARPIIGTGPAAPGTPFALPQPVGCLPGRPADEPCEHRAHIVVDPANRHAMVLGTQGLAIVPFPAGTFPLR